MSVHRARPSESRRLPTRLVPPSAVLVVTALAALAAVVMAAPGASSPGAAAPREVTPATGPSLLTRLRTGFDQSSVGRAGYLGAPPAAVEAEAASAPTSSGWFVRGFELSGEDLYRVNCRSCHGVGAQGLAPITPSIVGRVRKGEADPDPDARRRRAGTEMAIRHRLLEGGLVMPQFTQLGTDEVTALIGYLETIAGVAEGGGPASRLELPALVVGEQVVKSVCQICHDATPGMPHAGGEVISPALSEIPEKYSVRALVRAVRAGAVPPPARARTGRAWATCATRSSRPRTSI